MKTFKNKQFKKRDYEGTNIVFCQSAANPNPNIWVEADEIDLQLSGCYQLWIENDIRFFGWL
jgi:hypothetical protein